METIFKENIKDFRKRISSVKGKDGIKETV
jgi:hypothetical protein